MFGGGDSSGFKSHLFSPTTKKRIGWSPQAYFSLAYTVMPANGIQMGKEYMGPSAFLTFLGIITVGSSSCWQVDPVWDKYKVIPGVIKSGRTREEKDITNAVILLDTVATHSEHAVTGDI